MAYMNFAAEDFADGVAYRRESPSFTQSAGQADLFTWEELSVIDLAKHDGVWSLRPDSRLRRLGAFLFGIEPAKPLANKRLESLRRLAVQVWRRGKLTRAAVEEFLAAGFSRRHAEAVLAKISRGQRLDAWPEGLA